MNESQSIRIAVPDMISNSYFPMIAAVDLGFFKPYGFDASVELIFPVDRCYEAMRAGEVDIVAGSAHSALSAFPDWRGVKLLAAQAQHMYWFLVMRPDLAGARGDLTVLKGRRIGAAPSVELGLRRLLIAAGIDPAANGIEIAPAPGAFGVSTNFGLMAAEALASGKIDGFWANGMGAAIAVAKGVGRVVVDVRRGDGPREAQQFTFAAIAATDHLIDTEPDKVEATVRALVATQKALKKDASLAAEVAGKRFPATEAALLPSIIERDLPYYSAEITPASVQGLNRFARDCGNLASVPSYADVVAMRFAHLWSC